MLQAGLVHILRLSTYGRAAVSLILPELSHFKHSPRAQEPRAWVDRSARVRRANVPLITNPQLDPFNTVAVPVSCSPSHRQPQLNSLQIVHPYSVDH
jgi:hypothetical protein